MNTTQHISRTALACAICTRDIPEGSPQFWLGTITPVRGQINFFAHSDCVLPLLSSRARATLRDDGVAPQE